MKKIIVSILAFLYLGVSSGIAMKIHYCMGKKAGIELYGSDNGKCGKCGMKEKKSGCCNDEHKFYKLNDSHKNVSNNLNFETPVAVITNIFPQYNCEIVTNPFYKVVNNNSPPDYTKPTVCIMNCIFRL